MKLDQISVAMLREAVDIFVRLAFDEDSAPPPIELPAGDRVEEVLADFTDDSPAARRKDSRCFLVRIGSAEYPFMKLALQEYLLEDQFFFMVDTHDQMELKPGMRDYEAWNELKKKNRERKRRIEEAWSSASIPTLADLERITEQVSVGAPVSPQRTILIVDDEVPLADSLGTLLRRKGYRVTTTYDGRAALDELEQQRPDLIVMDYEMPRLTGMELCERLRRSRETMDIPVLLATASTLDLGQVMKLANGFLVKPYQKEILFDCIDHLIGASDGGTGSEGAPP